MDLNRLFALGLAEGSKAPEFTLRDQEGAPHQLVSYLGQWVLLFFYPKDLSPGCTAQACSFRDHAQDFSDLGVHPLGISVDSGESHRNFAKKHHLSFPLLSDTTREVSRAYEVLLPLGIANRVTFLINPNGFIAARYRWIRWKNYAPTVLHKIQNILNPGRSKEVPL